MKIRPPRVANMFYPGNAYAARIKLEEMLKGIEEYNVEGRIYGAIVPHAGWDFSGSVALKVFYNIHKRVNPDVFVIFGAHTEGLYANCTMTDTLWETPFSQIEVDTQLANELLKKSNVLNDDERILYMEHSIEVQLPIIKYFFKDAKIFPIMPSCNEKAIELGYFLGKLVKEKEQTILIIGSTDLTHYGPNYDYYPYGIGANAVRKIKNDIDQRIITLMLNLEEDKIFEEVCKNRNACGSGAIAATIAAVKTMGATKGILLEYKSSYDVMPSNSFVGYAGIIFV